VAWRVLAQVWRVLDACGWVVAIIFVVIAFVRIGDINTKLTGTVDAGANTRITTVEARCALTALIVGLAEHVDPAHVAPFIASYRLCEQQLVGVKRIAHNAPR
jgi:hypothetical protein